MNKKCLSIQSKIDRFLRGELSQNARHRVALHLGECENCAQALEFRRKLDARLEAPIEVTEAVTQRVLDLANNRGLAPSRRPTVKTLLGDPIMKRIVLSSAAVSVICIGVALFVPSKAPAASPQAAFLAMKRAILSNQRLAKIIKKPTNQGSKTELELTTAKVMSSVAYLDLRGGPQTVDLDPNNYSMISFGQTKNQILLTPKDNPNRRDEWVLYDQTNLPRAWSSYTLKPTGWVRQAFLRFNLANPDFEYTFDPKSGAYYVIPRILIKEPRAFRRSKNLDSKPKQ